MRGSRIPALGRAAFAAAAPTLLLVSLTKTVRATGAVPGDEFHAAGLLYGALSWLGPASVGLALAAGLLMGLGALRAPMACPRGRVLLAVAAAATMAAPLLATPWLVILATTCLAVRGAGTARARLAESAGPRRERLVAISASLASLAPRTLVRWAFVLSLLAAAGALLITLAESFVYTRRFAPELFPSEALLPYRWHLAELSAAFGLGLGIAYLVPIISVSLLIRRAGGAERPTGVLVLATVVSGTMFLYLGAATFVHVGSEIIATGCLPHTIGYLLLVMSHVVSTVLRTFTALDYEIPGGAPTPGRLWAIAAGATLTFPLTWLGARARALRDHPRALFLLSAVAAAFWVTLLVWTSYPDLEDFRSQFIFIGVITAVHVLVVGLLALAFAATRGGRRLSRPVLVASMLALVTLLASSARTVADDRALILNEYSRFGYVVKKASLRELFHGYSLGYEEPSGRHTFEPHGPGEERLPSTVPAPLKGKTPPIICILWDAARPDRMGCYGHDRDTTPFGDELAKDSVIFDNAYSMATATTCGVRHIMTGRYSTRYMLAKDHDPFFVHDLRKHGYDRFLVTAFGSDFNGVSIESWERNGPPPETDGSRFEHLTRHPEGLNREIPEPRKAAKMIEAWRKVHAERGSLDGTFSFLHFTGAHFPWYNRDAVKDFGTGYKDLYDGELAKVDALTGKALQCLKDLDQYDDAIILLFADHGTGLREHGRWAGFLPYEEQLRIPLLIKMPGVTPRRVGGPVGTIDFAPTLLGLFEPGAENPYDGVSLMPLLTGEADRLQRRHAVSLCAFEDAYALIEDGRWKLHYHRSEGYALLFDLRNDPMERRNLYNTEPEVAERLEGVLGDWLWKGRGKWGHPHHYRR